MPNCCRLGSTLIHLMRVPFTNHAAAMTIACIALHGCSTGVRSDPAMATRPYPFQLTQERVIEAQVLNDGVDMVIVNATVLEFNNVDVWLNQRYMRHIEHISAGETLRLSIIDFWDHRGEAPFPGGIFRRFQPTPIRLVQIQTGATDPLIGLIAIPTEREIDKSRLATQ